MMKRRILLAVCSLCLLSSHSFQVTYGADSGGFKADKRITLPDTSTSSAAMNVPRANDGVQDYGVTPAQTESLILLLLGAALLVVATGVRILQTRKSQMGNH